ncbi:hypothetical protein E4K65_17655 [Bradyrhizobium niftali]|uniref:Uncharacterized protein n=1 Tax=Bradyrhizobium niftali TaxID=2560055 RepID=A0A4Y9LVS0_9BRAD|nr:hypothetical protein E4K65_17655 [Bradyrhizobium niftali]
MGRAIQYSRGGCDGAERPRRTGFPAFAGNDSVIWRASPYLILRHCERSEAIQNPSAVTVWIASLCSK